MPAAERGLCHFAALTANETKQPDVNQQPNNSERLPRPSAAISNKLKQIRAEMSTVISQSQWQLT